MEKKTIPARPHYDHLPPPENEYPDQSELAFNYDEWGEDPREDDYCCYDPRYTGPAGHCHCKEYAEQEARDNKWYNRLWYWLHIQKYTLADWLSPLFHRKPNSKTKVDNDLPF